MKERTATGLLKLRGIADPTLAQDGATKAYADAGDATTAAAGIAKSILTTKGDLIIATAASTPARQGVPANGSLLIAASAQTNGWTTGDHGAIGGLADDDHQQYSLATGTRAFSGTVAGVDPTTNAHLATKLYADKKARVWKSIGTSPFELRHLCGHSGGGAAIPTGTPVIDTLYAVPCRSLPAGTIDTISFEVTGAAAGSSARVGLYTHTSDTNLYPSALAVDGGTIVTTANGVKDATISYVVEPDKFYWAVFTSGVLAPTIRGLNANNIDVGLIGWRSTLGGGLPGVCLTVAQAYGALPSTFPASATIATAVPIPAIWIRYGA